MAVFRVERTKDYTVMSNFHLKDKNLSLKAKGLLSQMLSLPDNWDYTLAGLSQINRESKDAIRSAVNELEAAGYVYRHQTTDTSGKFSVNEYIIYEHPISSFPSLANPLSENPTTENPSSENPLSENPTQLNTKKSNTKKQKTNKSNTHSIPFRKPVNNQAATAGLKDRDMMPMDSYKNYRDKILDKIEYDVLAENYAPYLENLNEIVELITETVCANRITTRIAGSDFPHELVRSRFLMLTRFHIENVMDHLITNTTEIRNIKQYLLTVLFNSLTTMNNQSTVQANHDMQSCRR